jgi:hypothetical protein
VLLVRVRRRCRDPALSAPIGYPPLSPKTIAPLPCTLTRSAVPGVMQREMHAVRRGPHAQSCGRQSLVRSTAWCPNCAPQGVSVTWLHLHVAGRVGAARESARCSTNTKIVAGAQRTIALRAKQQGLDMSDPTMQQAVSEAVIELQQEMVENCVMAAVENDPELVECQKVSERQRLFVVVVGAPHSWVLMWILLPLRTTMTLPVHRPAGAGRRNDGPLCD